MTPIIHRVTTLDLRVEPWPWPFAAARRAEIDSHFEAKKRKLPGLWNGRVLLGRNPRFADLLFGAEYFETDFASFLAWRDWGFPDPDVFNGFGMGALLSNDGAFALGEMGGHTANAGRIYFPAGTPDLDDVRTDARGKMLDIEGSVAREVEEETGLAPSDYRADPHWDCVFTGAVGRPDADIACRSAGRSAAGADRGQPGAATGAGTRGDPPGPRQR